MELTYIPPKMERLDSVAQIEGHENWSPDDVADYFEKEGLGDYREVLTYHKISGKVAPQLTDVDLKDMGIKIVGDRCRFRHVIKNVGRRARATQRNKVIWEGKERLWFDGCEGCMNTCCGIFPEDPSTYKLTNNHLKIRTVAPARLGPFRLCCCHEYKVNNIDLSQVVDVDVNGIPPPALQQCLCCAEGKEIVDIELTNEGPIFLTLKQGEGDQVGSLIMNQVEESQQIERD